MAYIQSLRGQQWLLPPSIEDLIPEDHVCFLVEEFMDSLDYGSFDVEYSGPGHPAYHPRILLKLLVMGVLDRVRSSRRLARNARENIVYMYLAEKLVPDFRTISDFRKNNPHLIKEVFKHTVMLARREGMLDLSHLSTDGSKVRANAADKRILTRPELDFLTRFVDEELEEWARRDLIEDEEYGELRGSDQLPGKSRKKIQGAVKHYVSEYKKKGGVFKENLKDRLAKTGREMREHKLAKASTTDPESRFMRGGKTRIRLSYNTQVTVDGNGFILAADVTKDLNDVKQLRPQVNQTKETLDTLPENVKWFFDNGYFEGGNLRFLEDQEIDGYIPGQEKKKKNPYDKENFRYDSLRDEYVCPQGQPVVFLYETRGEKGKRIRVYEGVECNTCRRQNQCTKTKTGLRRIKQYPFERERYAMKEKMKSPRAREVYSLRRQTVEPVIGDLKENKSLAGFLTRALKTVGNEFRLACTAANLKKQWIKQQEKNKNLVEINPFNSGIQYAFIRILHMNARQT